MTAGIYNSNHWHRNEYTQRVLHFGQNNIRSLAGGINHLKIKCKSILDGQSNLNTVIEINTNISNILIDGFVIQNTFLNGIINNGANVIITNTVLSNINLPGRIWNLYPWLLRET